MKNRIAFIFSIVASVAISIAASFLIVKGGSQKQNGNSASPPAVEKPLASSEVKTTPRADGLPANKQIGTPTSQIKIKSLKEVDFANFTYPATEELLRRTGETQITMNEKGILRRNQWGDITLDMGISYLYFGNMTGQDNATDVAVVVYYTGGGSGQWAATYIYTLQNQELKLLWSFDSGDRSDGGLRNIYAESGRLVVETYKDTGLGACCADSISRSVYQWDGKQFQTIKALTLAIPKSGAGPVFPFYSHRKRD